MDSFKSWLFKTRSIGCGPAWWPQLFCDLAFGWFFEASCAKHDEGYSKGGTEADRKRCDDLFLAAMLRDVKLQVVWRRPVAYVVAWSFYGLVRKFGHKLFSYGEV